MGAVSILLGLLHRQRTGAGQYIESPQLNAALAGLSHIVRRTDGAVLGGGRLDPMQFGFSALERLYLTADGWICISVLTDRDIAALRAALAGPLDGEWFTAGDLRVVDDDRLADALTTVFERRSTGEWLAELTAAGVPVAVPKAERNTTTFLRDPENRRTRRVAEVPHPVDIKVREIDQLIRVSDAVVPPHRIAPELGEHTDQILTWCGYSPSDIAALRAAGSVR